MLILLIVVLLITNLGMLWHFTHESKEEVKQVSRTERMADMMKKELGFNDVQAQEYIHLRLMRDSIMKPLNDSMRAARMELLELVRQSNVPDSMVLLAAQKIARAQVPLEVEFFRHFKRIQAVCKPEQLPQFDSMLVRMVRRNTGDTTVQVRNN
jgi:periplasmic protein CpxP/Spy